MILALLPVSALAADYDRHWAAEYITEANTRGWMMGDGQGNFRPNDSITRGEFSVMLWRALGSPAPQGGSPFTDVDDGIWYGDAVTALHEMGIVSGYGGGLFGPGDTLTREMAFVMLARAFGLAPNGPGEAAEYTTFDDYADVSSWATDAASILVLKGYVGGVGGNKLAPKKPLTRGEMAKLLVTVYDGENVPDEPGELDDTAPVITLTQSPTTSTYNNVKVSVSVQSENNISYIGWRASSSGAEYTDKTGFTDITDKKEFSVSSNGWYAVGIVDGAGNFSYTRMQITNIQTSSGGGGGSSGGTTPTVSSVTVSPASVSIGQGGTQQFTAVVSGTNSPAQTVTWMVENGTASSISANGLLTVAAAETAAMLTVRATSTVNTSKSGTAAVTVTDAPRALSVNIITGQSAYGEVSIEAGSATGNDSGSKVTVKAEPASGYVFVKWVLSDDRNAAAVYAGEEYTFTINADTTLYAVFNGDGTNAPVEISTIEQLEAIADKLELHYKLVNDIDLPEPLPGESNWTPIGNNSPAGNTSRFTGSLDGGGHTVSGLTVTKAVISNNNGYAGLFGYIGSGGTVKNLNLTDVKIDVAVADNISLYMGGVAGYNYGGRIENCAVSGIVTAVTDNNAYAGGIAGYNYGGRIAACHAAGDVSATGNNAEAGGVAGDNYGSNAIIADCYATGDVSATGNNAEAGGIAGHNSARIANCYATGDVSAESAGMPCAGGIAGYNLSGNIANCAALGNSVTATGGGMTCSGRVAGFSIGTITNCYGLDTMALTGSGGVDGVSLALSYFKTEGWWNGSGSGFWEDVWDTTDDAPWQWGGDIGIGSYTLPVLYWQRAADYPALPFHLSFAGGSGTVTSPYQINNPSGLQAMADGLDKHYELTANITLTGNRTPIGDGSKPFTGSFNGGGHTIKNLNINNAGSDDQGLFGVTDGAEIKDLTLEDCAVTGKGVVGGLVGYAINTSITGCGVSGNVSGDGVNIGGLVGYAYATNNGNVTIENCHATGSVEGSGYVGGLVGYAYAIYVGNLTIQNCYATGNVEGGRRGPLGGLVGDAYATNNGNVTIQNCYATGSIEGSGHAGGLVGYASTIDGNVTIQNCYATGSIEGGNYVGGLVGYASTIGSNVTVTIQNCYATGSVEGGNYVGGLVGYAYAVSNGNVTVQSCAALNPSVSGTSDVARVLGGIYAHSNGIVTLADNYANNAMTVNGSMVTSGDNDTASGINGAGIAIGDVKVQTWWSGASPNGPGFQFGTTDTAPWKWDSTQSMPILYWQTGGYPGVVPTGFGLLIQLPQTATLTLAATEGGTAVHDGKFGDTFLVDDTVTIAATPDAGYVFAEWRDENGEAVSTDAEYSFEITGDMTLTAVFTLVEEPQEQQDGETGGGGGDPPAALEPEPPILPQDEDDINGGDDGPEVIEE